MKRLIIETDKQVILEYHANETAALNALSYLQKVYKITKWAIKDVIKHVELPSRVEPRFTLKQYTEIK